MTDTKRDFLYEFNSGLRDIYSNNPSIVSVFENIDNGSLSLSPVGVPEESFVKEVGKCIFMIKKIVADPYKVFKGKQEIVPVSQAQNVDHESVKLTLSDPTVWSIEAGKKMPKQAYSLVKEYVFTNYENAFICQLINLLIPKLKVIKAKAFDSYANKDSQEYTDFVTTLDTYIHKLIRLSSERVFVENNRRVVDMSDIFVTDILASDGRYNYCYKFFCENFKSKSGKSNIIRDFRVLYHNFALVQVLYGLYKNGYNVNDANYYISVSGKMFIDSLTFNGAKTITVFATKNGVDISSDSNVYHVEFSKSLIKSSVEVANDYGTRATALNSSKGYAKVFVAYLSSEEQLVDGALSIGYNNVSEAISKLINSL